MSHPSTPSSFVVPSPGGASVSSFHEEFENINSPASTQSWAGSSGTTVSVRRVAAILALMG